MKLTVDHYFHIGHMHYTSGKPCQDHALSLSGTGFAGVVVSDGCSSGGNTDIGSRIISCATVQGIIDHRNASPNSLQTATQSIVTRQKQILSSARPLLGLAENDLLATCVYAYASEIGALISIQGDGAYAIKHKSGSMIIGKFEWLDNMPFYPAYRERNLEIFIDAQKKNGEKPYTNETFYLDSQGHYLSPIINSYTAEEGVNGIQIPISVDELKNIELIAVFTDGVVQVDGVTWIDAIKEFLAFKNFGGGFCRRRMKRAIKDFQSIIKDPQNNTGKGPQDDIACAVIHIEDDGG